MAGRPVILVGEGPAADAKARLLVRAGAKIVHQDDRAARIAVVALEDGEHAAMTADHLRGRGILVNVVDRPGLSDFIFPAIVDRAPVTVAIGTGGMSAGLAKAIRGILEALLPADLGGLAKALASARAAIRVRWPDPLDRRQALDAALAPGGMLDPLVTDGGDSDGAERVTDWLAQADAPVTVRLATIRLRSTDPDELTLHAARLLTRADRVYHRENVPAVILHRARADAERIACDFPPSALPPGLSVDLGFA
jgi:uroporphyrin-III C-methyltransferase/precorrin-2 dehydrogenase/sirohydrochlorin ferrochelatase